MNPEGSSRDNEVSGNLPRHFEYETRQPLKARPYVRKKCCECPIVDLFDLLLTRPIRGIVEVQPCR